MTNRTAATTLLVVLACSRSERFTSDTKVTTPSASAEPRTSPQVSSAARPVASLSTASVENLLAGNEPMVIGGEVTAPIVMDRVEPEWPEGVTKGMFWSFSAVVTKDGRVRDLELTMGQPGSHSRAAEKAIKQWRFKPGTYRGQPVDVKYNLSVRIHVR